VPGGGCPGGAPAVRNASAVVEKLSWELLACEGLLSSDVAVAGVESSGELKSSSSLDPVLTVALKGCRSWQELK